MGSWVLEAINLPAIELIIDDLAPTNQKRLYFAAAELRQLGFAVGPAIGGYLLEYSGRKAFLVAMSVVILIPLFLIPLKGARLPVSGGKQALE